MSCYARVTDWRFWLGVTLLHLRHVSVAVVDVLLIVVSVSSLLGSFVLVSGGASVCLLPIFICDRLCKYKDLSCQMSTVPCVSMPCVLHTCVFIPLFTSYSHMQDKMVGNDLCYKLFG